MDFKDYQSKPITRTAAVIPEGVPIVYTPENSEATVSDVTFKCYEKPVAGDFVVHLSEEDVYHCSKAVFAERNVL